MSAVYQSLVTIDPFTMLCTIANLFIQMLIVKHFLLDKVLAVLDERRRAAEAQLADADQARAAAEAMKTEYEKNMADVKQQANDLLVNAQKTASARSESIVGEARMAAAQIKRNAEEDIAQERRKAMNDVKNEIGDMAMEIASKVVEREIDQKDHQQLIDEFIKNVGEAS